MPESDDQEILDQLIRGGGHPAPTANPEEIARACAIGSEERGGVGILIVSHGSHSPIWRRALLDVQTEVADNLLQIPSVRQVRSAFMEYTEPSIANQLRALDAAGIETVVIVPMLLTISDHSYDDIPVICGVREDVAIAARLATERIETYHSTARLIFAPLLDFTQLVQRNLARRLATLLGEPEALRRSSERLGLVLVGYGSAEFDEEWNQFFTKIDHFAESELGVAGAIHAWCGHLVHYSPQPTVDAINRMLADYDRVAVAPIFVAYDPMFHKTILGRAVSQSSSSERVVYSATAILPEPEVGRWVAAISAEMIAAVRS
ncbi:MAG: CbiX/SirB N-terminal domain-containing protein [Dehalococcoidia bacterium]